MKKYILVAFVALSTFAYSEKIVNKEQTEFQNMFKEVTAQLEAEGKETSQEGNLLAQGLLKRLNYYLNSKEGQEFRKELVRATGNSSKHIERARIDGLKRLDQVLPMLLKESGTMLKQMNDDFEGGNKQQIKKTN